MSKTKTMTKQEYSKILQAIHRRSSLLFGTIYMGNASSLVTNPYFCCPGFHPKNLPARISAKNPFLLGGPNCLFLLLPPCISTFHICTLSSTLHYGEVVILGFLKGPTFTIIFMQIFISSVLKFSMRCKMYTKSR